MKKENEIHWYEKTIFERSISGDCFPYIVHVTGIYVYPVTLVDMMHEVAGSKIRKLFGCGMRTPRYMREQNIMKM